MIETVEVDLGPGVRALFTTRAGGVSSDEYASLNLGLGVEDAPARVLANRDLVGRHVGAPVVYGRQVHGAGVRHVARPLGPGSAYVGEADALTTTAAAVALGVYVADCFPILLAGSSGAAGDDTRVVATAHVGRGGLVAGVVGAAVAAMTGLGARRVRAAVGPGICAGCYEVPAALREEVAAVVPETWATTSWDTPSLDLRAGALAQLAQVGVTEVDLVDACTFTDERFYSHRRWGRDRERRGRFAGVVRLR